MWAWVCVWGGRKGVECGKGWEEEREERERKRGEEWRTVVVVLVVRTYALTDEFLLTRQ